MKKPQELYDQPLASILQIAHSAACSWLEVTFTGGGNLTVYIEPELGRKNVVWLSVEDLRHEFACDTTWEAVESCLRAACQRYASNVVLYMEQEDAI